MPVHKGEAAYPGRLAEPRPCTPPGESRTPRAAVHHDERGGPVLEIYPEGCELVWRRTFPGLAEHARRAREFVAFLLADLPGLDDVVLVTGEFVANALRHTSSALPG